MELLSVEMKRAEQCGDRTNDPLNVIELVTVLLAHSRHLCPMRQWSQVMFLVVTVVEGQQIVNAAVITHGVGIVVFRRRAVMFVVILYVDQRQREEERRQVTEQ